MSKLRILSRRWLVGHPNEGHSTLNQLREESKKKKKFNKFQSATSWMVTKYVMCDANNYHYDQHKTKQNKIECKNFTIVLPQNFSQT